MKIPRGPVYRVVDGEIADGIALALETRKPYFNMAPQFEGPGHRACMIYSAMTCPHLASPEARRKTERNAGPEPLLKGDKRGPSAAVAGFDGYTWKVGAQALEIYYGPPVELLRYAEGADLADVLNAEIAREQGPVQQCPPYLLDDDTKAEETAKAIVTGDDGSRASALRRQEQARKDRRKAIKSSRRKNR